MSRVVSVWGEREEGVGGGRGDMGVCVRREGGMCLER